MWWMIKKNADNAKYVSYFYSREANELSGEILFDRATQQFNIVKLASNDSKPSAEMFFQHLASAILDENCPDEKMIAIG